MAKISVVIPFHNREKFIGSCIESVLAQNRRPDEIIVVDDASSPSARDFLQRFSHVAKIIRLEPNQGPAVARNLGVKHASADLIAFIDDDDLWEPDKLEKQHAYMEENPGCAAVHTGTLVFSENGHSKVYLNKPSPLTVRDLLISSHVVTPSLMIRAEVFRNLGGFNPSFQSSEDYEFSIRLVASGHRVDFLPLPLTSVRRCNHGNLSSKWLNVLRGHVKMSITHKNLYNKENCAGTFREHIGKHLRRAGRSRGGVLGRLVYAFGWVVGHEIAV